MAYSDSHRYKIDRETIERILDSAKIEEVVGDFVTLKRRGVNLIGLCPFHNEKTPSFSVSASKGIYKCFGCGKTGNAINFVMESESATYPEALRIIAKRYGIDRNRAVNYNADAQGTSVLYETVSKAVCNVRASKCMADDWSADIDNDYRNRSKKR